MHSFEVDRHAHCSVVLQHYVMSHVNSDTPPRHTNVIKTKNAIIIYQTSL